MNRRGFLKLFGGAAAAAAAAPMIPFGRVWSFPSKIVVPELSLDELEDLYLKPAMHQLFNTIDLSLCDPEFRKHFAVGTTIRLRIPQRFIVRESRGVIGRALGFDYNDERIDTSVTLQARPAGRPWPS